MATDQEKEAYIAAHPEDREYAAAYAASKGSPKATAVGAAPGPGKADLSSPPVAQTPELPTEWHPNRPAQRGLMGAFGDLLQSMPATLPGMGDIGTIMWKDPSLHDFRVATGLQDKGVDSPEYKQFADAKWKEAVAQAQAANGGGGRGIVRVDAQHPKSILDKVGLAAASLMEGDAPEAAAAGAGDIATAGTLTRVVPAALERAGVTPPGSGTFFKDAVEEHPGTALVGSLLGSGPMSIPGKIAKAIPGIGGQAIAAAATRAGEDASQGVADSLGSPKPLDASEILGAGFDAIDPGKAAMAAGTAGVLGTAGEALGPKLGGALKRMGDRLRTEEPDIRVLEAAGGKLGGLGRGLKLPEGMKAAETEALEPGKYGARFPEDIAASKVATPIAKNIIAKRNALDDQWSGFLSAYEKTPEGKVALPPTHAAEALLKAVETRSHEGGGTVAFTSRDALKRFLPEMFDSNGDVRPLTAPQFEVMLRDLQEKVKDSGVFREIAAAARMDREAYPWPKSFPEQAATTDAGRTVTGFAAAHTNWHQKMSELEGQLTRAGVQVSRNPMLPDVEPQVQSSVRHAGQPGREPLTQALHELADSDATRTGLREQPAYGAAERLRGRGQVNPTMPRSRGNIMAARLALDPTREALAGALPSAAPQAAQAAANSLSSKDFDLVRMLYGL